MPISVGLRTSILATSGALNVVTGTHFFLTCPILKRVLVTSPSPATSSSSLNAAQGTTEHTDTRKVGHPVLLNVLRAERTRSWLVAVVGLLELGVAYLSHRHPKKPTERLNVTAMGITFAAGKVANLVLAIDLYNVAKAVWGGWRWKRRQRKLKEKGDALELDKPATALVVVWSLVEAAGMVLVMSSGTFYNAVFY